jgi:hypothetical protein
MAVSAAATDLHAQQRACIVPCAAVGALAEPPVVRAYSHPREVAYAILYGARQPLHRDVIVNEAILRALLPQGNLKSMRQQMSNKLNAELNGAASRFDKPQQNTFSLNDYSVYRGLPLRETATAAASAAATYLHPNEAGGAPHVAALSVPAPAPMPTASGVLAAPQIAALLAQIAQVAQAVSAAPQIGNAPVATAPIPLIAAQPVHSTLLTATTPWHAGPRPPLPTAFAQTRPDASGYVIELDTGSSPRGSAPARSTPQCCRASIVVGRVDGGSAGASTQSRRSDRVHDRCCERDRSLGVGSAAVLSRSGSGPGASRASSHTGARDGVDGPEAHGHAGTVIAKIVAEMEKMEGNVEATRWRQKLTGLRGADLARLVEHVERRGSCMAARIGKW